MGSKRPLVVTAILAVSVLAAGALVWRVLTPGAEDAAEAVTEAVDTSEPHMDLERLTERDLAFLGTTLATGSPEARRSAAKALVIASRIEGAPLLFEAARAGGEDAFTFCLAALEVLRLQRADQSLRELLLALRDGGELPEDCRVEVADRFGLVGRGQLAAVLALADAPEAEVRAWVAETLAGRAGLGVEQALVDLAADPEVLVRRAAWLAWAGRSPAEVHLEALGSAAAAEQDARNREILEGLEWL